MTRRCVTPTPNDRKWPVAPLVAAAGSAYQLQLVLESRGIIIGQSSLTGLIGDKRADRYAIALGLHPSMVWPEWDAAGMTVLDEMHVNGGGWRHAWLHDQPTQRREVSSWPAPAQ